MRTIIIAKTPGDDIRIWNFQTNWVDDAKADAAFKEAIEVLARAWNKLNPEVEA